MNTALRRNAVDRGGGNMMLPRIFNKIPLCPMCRAQMEKRNGIIIPSEGAIFTERLHRTYCANFWICVPCNQEGIA